MRFGNCPSIGARPPSVWPTAASLRGRVAYYCRHRRRHRETQLSVIRRSSWTSERELSVPRMCSNLHRERQPDGMGIGEIIDFAALDADIQELIRESAAVRENSYSPYSKFKVGAAVRCADGSISRGCNVENASYPAGVCAEVTAIARAVSDGKRRFTALTVVADQDSTTFTTPCGVCRQFIAEFGGNIPIYLSRTDMKKVLRTTTNELFPLSPFRNDTREEAAS